GAARTRRAAAPGQVPAAQACAVDENRRMPIALRVVRPVVAPITRTRVLRASAPVWMPPVERVLARLSGDRVQLSSLLVPSLVLTTTGARTGEPRETVLMYTPDGRG